VFLDIKVPLWADGQKVTIAERSEGHNLVYVIATGNGGYSGAHHLYELFCRTISSVSQGRRRATERERHERVVKPLAGSVFKYLDQLHVDKGGLPGLKDCAKLIWNDPNWVNNPELKPEIIVIPPIGSAPPVNPRQILSDKWAQEQIAKQATMPPMPGQNPNPHGQGPEARKRALNVLRNRKHEEKQKRKQLEEDAKKEEAASVPEEKKLTMDEILDEEFGEMSFEDMLADLKDEGMSSFGTGVGNAVLEEGMFDQFGARKQGQSGLGLPALDLGISSQESVGLEGGEDDVDRIDQGGKNEDGVEGEVTNGADAKRKRSRGGKKKKKK